MKKITMSKTVALACGVLLGMALNARAAEWESDTGQAQQSERFQRVYGETLPPIGYVGFCMTHTRECANRSVRRRRIVMSDQRWTELTRVNTYVNYKIEPVTDQDLYDVPELWTFPTTQGDCEDYVLLKRRYLMGLGWPADTLLITVVLDEQGEGHAVLTVTTNQGDFVLDNRNSDILAWRDTPYRFIKRQSQSEANKWVALDPTIDRRPMASGRLSIDR